MGKRTGQTQRPLDIAAWLCGVTNRRPELVVQTLAAVNAWWLRFPAGESTVECIFAFPPGIACDSCRCGEPEISGVLQRWALEYKRLRICNDRSEVTWRECRSTSSNSLAVLLDIEGDMLAVVVWGMI